MKQIFYLVILISAFIKTEAQNPVPNPGFESWSGAPLSPDEWYSNGTANNITITRVAGNTGSYAAQGNVIQSATSTIISPYLGCNFQLTQRYSSMVFYYKANLDSGDVLQASAAIYDTAGVFLASNYFNIVFSSSTFTPFILSVDSVSPGVPDFALITFTIIPLNPNASISSYFAIDDVELFNGTLGISEGMNAVSLRLFPNPASEKIFIQAGMNETKSPAIELFDISGRLILRKESTFPVGGIISDNLSLENILPGIYLLRITGEKECLSKSIVVR